MSRNGLGRWANEQLPLTRKRALVWAAATGVAVGVAILAIAVTIRFTQTEPVARHRENQQTRRLTADQVAAIATRIARLERPTPREFERQLVKALDFCVRHRGCRIKFEQAAGAPVEPPGPARGVRTPPPAAPGRGRGREGGGRRGHPHHGGPREPTASAAPPPSSPPPGAPPPGLPGLPGVAVCIGPLRVGACP